MKVPLSIAAICLSLLACGGGDDDDNGLTGWRPGSGGGSTGSGGQNGAGGDGGSAPVVKGEAFCSAVKAKFKDLPDIHKYTIARSCAFSNDECHHDEDPPPMHSVGLMLTMVNMPCNSGLPDPKEWDDFCKPASEGGQDGKLVVPGNAADSYLMIRLTGDSRSTRVPMPSGSPALAAEELYAIEAWINSMSDSPKASDPIDYDKTACPD